MKARLRRSCWLLLGVSLQSAGCFLQVLRRELLLSAPAAMLRPAAVQAEGFDPFGEEQKKKAPKDLKSPPLDAEVTASGLKWKILKKADCEAQKCAKPRAFDKVSVAFIGWEPDGREFLSSRTRGRVQFYVGDVIRGWGEGLQLMNVNETARLWIPSDLAFGSEGKGGPPGDIVIDVTLYGLKRGQPAPPKPTELSVPKDAVIEKSGLATKVLIAGNGTETAKDANRATVEWYGWTADGNLFDAGANRGSAAKEVQQQNVPKGFWEGIKLMTVGETRRFWVPPELGYGSSRTDGGPTGLLIFDVNLVSFRTDFNPF